MVVVRISPKPLSVLDSMRRVAHTSFVDVCEGVAMARTLCGGLDVSTALTEGRDRRFLGTICHAELRSAPATVHCGPTTSRPARQSACKGANGGKRNSLRKEGEQEAPQIRTRIKHSPIDRLVFPYEGNFSLHTEFSLQPSRGCFSAVTCRVHSKEADTIRFGTRCA